MKADFSYMTGSDGFTSILPDTPEAEREYNRIFAETGSLRLTPLEFHEFRQKARAAGYSVRKLTPNNAEISVGELAGLLEQENQSF
ncbi:hypothetical protein [Acidicapsa ligni]|uniref:hypothetical protein n=1 Tax=Acidicapsa ligni TaxID=542300 RepID=UPI0021E0993B|nr:hypothetical protein [Acidicapsa ligni]